MIDKNMAEFQHYDVADDYKNTIDSLEDMHMFYKHTSIYSIQSPIAYDFSSV